MIPLVFGLFGLIVGSFLNVVILRQGLRSIGGRSACMTCAKQLEWFDMIPVLSWIVLRGRCRMCKAPISIQYPLVEAITALLFVLIGGAPFPVDYLYRFFFCAIAALLIAIAVYDFYHTIIPDLWVWMFNILALVAMGPILLTLAPEASALLYLLSGPIAASLIFVLWFFSRGAAMGFGDVKLALGIGWLLGPAHGLFAIFLAFIIGGIVSAPLLLFSSEWWARVMQRFLPSWSKKLTAGYTMKSEIPFGPFLIAACFCTWFALLYGISLPLLWIY